MKKRHEFMTKLFTIITLFLSVLGLSTSAYSEQSSQSNVYTVSANERDFLARYIFSTIEQQSKLTFEYVDYPIFRERLSAVEDRKVDFVANVTYTRSRAQRFHYSPPINIEPTYIFSARELPFDEMKVIGTTMGTAFNDIIQRHYPTKQVLGFNDNDVAFESLRADDIDGYIGTFLQLEAFLGAGFKATLINDKVSIPPVSIITNKPENLALLDMFSDIISQDEVQKQIRAYMETYIANIAIAQLQSKLASTGLDLSVPVTIYLNPRHPYVYSDAKGQPTGVSVDFATEVCNLNKLKCEFIYNPQELWGDTLNKLKQAERDVTTPIADSPSRRFYLNFSRPYVSIEGAVAKRVGYKEEVYKHISELFAEKVGVVKEDVFEKVTSRLLPNKELVYYDDTDSMLNGLNLGDINYAITSQVTLNALLYEHRITSITEDKFFNPFYQSELSFGFPKTERGKILAELFDRTLDFVDAQTINHRYQAPVNWRELNEKENDKRRLNIINALLILLALTTLLFGFITNHRANHDALTRLKNRHALNRIRRQALDKDHGLIYIDLNRFKHINDTYGHGVGDQVLRCYAKIMKEHIEGHLYRIGGDEFVAITPLSEDNLNTLLPALERFRFEVRGQDLMLNLTASVGVFLPNISELSIKQLMIYTDFAMYEAKRAQHIGSVVVDKDKLDSLIAMHEPKKRTHSSRPGT